MVWQAVLDTDLTFFFSLPAFPPSLGPFLDQIAATDQTGLCRADGAEAASNLLGTPCP